MRENPFNSSCTKKALVDAPVVVAKDNYEAKLSWFPANPKPGDLVRYRLEIKIPGGGAPTLLVKTTVSKTAPGAVVEAKPKSEVPPEATPQDGRYVFSGVKQTTLSLQLRLNYSFTPGLTLEAYA